MSYQGNTNPDSTLVQVSLSNIIKANKCFIEVKHRRAQMELCEEMVKEKDRVIRDLLKANYISHDLNKQYQEKEKALNQKALEYENLTKDYKFELKKANKRELGLKIGTPILGISVGVLAFLLGFYIPH